MDTGSHQYIIGMLGWEIIERHDSYMDAQFVNIGGPSKSGRRLQLVYTRGEVKNRLDGKNYLVIVRQALFNQNSDENLLAEDQLECYGVKVYSLPKFFGGKHIIDARDQVGHSIKLGISWDG